MSAMLNNKKLKKIRISNNQLLMICGAWIALISAYLVLWTIVAKPRLTTTDVQVRLTWSSGSVATVPSVTVQVASL